MGHLGNRNCTLRGRRCNHKDNPAGPRNPNAKPHLNHQIETLKPIPSSSGSRKRHIRKNHEKNLKTRWMAGCPWDPRLLSPLPRTPGRCPGDFPKFMCPFLSWSVWPRKKTMALNKNHRENNFLEISCRMLKLFCDPGILGKEGPFWRIARQERIFFFNRITAGFLYRAGAETPLNFREKFRVSPANILETFSAVDTQTAVLVSTAEVWISAPDTQTPIFLGFAGIHSWLWFLCRETKIFGYLPEVPVTKIRVSAPGLYKNPTVKECF